MTPPKFVNKPAPASAYTYYANKPRRGLYLHHTAGRAYLDNATIAPAPTPVAGASWHRLFRPDGEVWLVVPEATGAAHCVLKTDIFTPTWQLRSPPPHAVSDANYSADNWEIQYAPQAPYNERPTPAQLASIRYCLAQEYAARGPFPILGHGMVQSNKEPTEPTGLVWEEIGCYDFVPLQGFYYTPSLPPSPPTANEPPMNPASPDVIYGWLSSLGINLNPETAIYKFAAEAFVTGLPPFGNWRGPAISDEYPATTDDGRSVVRQKFTAGIAEYDLATGGIGWCEVVAHPELIG